MSGGTNVQILIRAISENRVCRSSLVQILKTHRSGIEEGYAWRYWNRDVYMVYRMIIPGMSKCVMIRSLREIDDLVTFFEE